MDDVSINAAIAQPTGQPKAISSGLISDCNSTNLPTGSYGFVPPTIEQLQQPFRIRINFLQRFAADARDQAGDQPTRQTHFDNDYERSILLEGGEAHFTVVVGFLHRKLRQ